LNLVGEGTRHFFMEKKSASNQQPKGKNINLFIAFIFIGEQGVTEL